MLQTLSRADISWNEFSHYLQTAQNLRLADTQLYNCTANGYCPPLSWQNCMNTKESFKFISYSHSPDPLIMDESSVIAKYAINSQNKYVMSHNISLYNCQCTSMRSKDNILYTNLYCTKIEK